ncbi:MAG: hypothetical protein N4A45_01430 [Flavobacteriales bacterium]|nr:hypothetical protein [Flavobacteriales bacterium]
MAGAEGNLDEESDFTTMLNDEVLYPQGFIVIGAFENRHFFMQNYKGFLNDNSGYMTGRNIHGGHGSPLTSEELYSF